MSRTPRTRLSPPRCRAVRPAAAMLSVLGAALLASLAAGCGTSSAPSHPGPADLIQGRYKAVFVDPGHAPPPASNGRAALQALTCRNPHCPGQGTHGRPFLFTRETARRKPSSPSGALTRDQQRDEQEAPIVCPACGESRWVEVYELPETARRREQLDKELHEAQRAMKAARAQGLQPAPGYRTPKEIMAEKGSLPRLYLLDEK